MREELGSRFARTSSCRHLVQFLAKFDQKCLLTDSLHRLGSRLARTSSVSLEMTLLLCATKSINSQNLHIIEKMLHSSYSVFDYLSESLRMERAFDQLPHNFTEGAILQIFRLVSKTKYSVILKSGNSDDFSILYASFAALQSHNEQQTELLHVIQRTVLSTQKNL